MSRSPKEEIESNLIKPPTRLTKLPRCLLNAERFEGRKEWVSQQHQRVAGSPPAMLLLLSLFQAKPAIWLSSSFQFDQLFHSPEGAKGKKRRREQLIGNDGDDDDLSPHCSVPMRHCCCCAGPPAQAPAPAPEHDCRTGHYTRAVSESE